MSQILLAHEWLLPIVPFVVAFLSVCWIHPRLVKVAYMKEIVDKPDQRKLQRRPIPVLGGVAVFFGIALVAGIFSPFYDSSQMVMILAAMTVMLYIGTLDDILTLSPGFRLFVEVVCVLLLILVDGMMIDHFHGLWGIGAIPWRAVSIGLTVIAAVGIINAVNLIDGVNGLSSGFCILACTSFMVFFFNARDIAMVLLAAGCIGALIPFFVHNVFGKTSRMFIGDGGTLVMGLVMSVFVIHTLDNSSLGAVFAPKRLGLIPFSLAVLAVPVFDTLRVMSTRCKRHVPLFRPDKTHLHHLFIGLGFSHIGTTLSILALNSLVTIGWWGIYRYGCSVDVQLYFVIGAGLLVTSGIYFGVKALPRNGRVYRGLRLLGYASHIERKPWFLRLRKVVDRV